MGKKTKPQPEAPHDEIHDAAEALNAKGLFIESALDMGWKLAVAFLTPILGGLWLDDRFDMSPSATITGFMIAATLSSMVVYSAVKDANKKVSKSFTKTEEEEQK